MHLQHAQARGRPRRARPAGRVAAAPAAALARGPALQRLGGRRGGRHRALRHRDARAGVVREPRARARPGQPQGRARPAAGLHPRALRPLRPGGHDHGPRGVRAVDAPQPRAHDRRGADPRRRWSAAWRSRASPASPSEPLQATPRRAGARRLRHRARSSSPTATCCRGVEIQTDLGTWQVYETPGPRAVARLPAPARAPAADLRRPPARPRLALLRPRPHAGPGGRVPATRSTSSSGSAPACAWPATGARSPTSRRTSTPTAGSSTSASAKVEEVVAGEPLTAFDAVPRVYGEAITPLNANWWLSRDALLPRAPGDEGRAIRRATAAGPSAGRA